MPVLNKVIHPILKKAKAENGGRNITFGDMFAGTGFVANYYKDSEYIDRIVSCDLELYSYVLNKALLTTVYSVKLEMILKFFNGPNLKPVKGLIWKHFSPAGGRLFFTEENAMRIDAIRITIARLYHIHAISYKETLFLLACLMNACSKSANSASCFRAYLKKFHPRSLRRIDIQPIHKSFTRIAKPHKMYKCDTIKLAKREVIDVAYLDPPYNSNHYGGYYSFYNYLLVYNKEYEISGVAGVTSAYNKSNFGFKATAKDTFYKLFENLAKTTKYIVMSYNGDGSLSKKTIIDVMRKFGDVTLYKTMNKKYRPSDRVKDTHVIEYIFVLKYGSPGWVRERWL